MGLAHRFAYIEANGPIPADKEIDHLCRNPSCVRPGHLEAVTSSENKIRASPYRKKVQTETHCANGHPWTASTEYRNPDGSRNCRACRNEAQLRYKARK
ncbi:HNH endonuclease signature motif containing protein [Xanthomonas citri pv. citri]